MLILVGCVCGFPAGMGPRDLAVRFRAAIAEKLPGLPHLFDFFEIEIGDEHLVLIAARLRNNLSTRIAEVTLPVEFANVPRGLFADPIDRPNEISVGNGVGWAMCN